MESTSNESDLIQKYKGKRQPTDLGMTSIYESYYYTLS